MVEVADLGLVIEHRADKYQVEGRKKELEVFMVRSLALPDGSVLPFEHHTFSPQGDTHVIAIPMPLTLIKRIGKFCTRYYVRGKRGFDCFTFVGFVMGWTGIAASRPDTHMSKEIVGPTETEPLTPYAIVRRGQVPHVMLSLMPELSLGVLGPNQPLVVATTPRIMRFYRGEGLSRIERMQVGR